MEVEIVCEGGGGENGGSRVTGEKGLCGNGSYLVWKDLTVMVIPSFGNVGGEKKVLLQGLNGYAEPGRIMAIMGPSGSGKSTLLDCLAGKAEVCFEKYGEVRVKYTNVDALTGRLLTNTIMTGNIFLNGKKCRPNNGAPAAYVTQKDILLGTLTVKETITYSANLRMPTAMSKAEINGIVEETITAMGLEDCAYTLIGIWGARGISGGERKRVCIALELVTKPPLLFLDEPTSGLDSASAFFIVHILKSLARDGRSVISSIHQPSSEVFAAFDDLFLLSGGETVYFGEAKMALQVNQNSDDPLVNMAAAEIKHRLVESYKRSNYAKHARTRIQELSSATEGVMPETQDGTKASWVKQLGTLTRRSLVNMSRDIGYYWLRLIIYAVVSFCVGILYYRIGLGHSNNAMLARISCMGFVFGFMTFMSIGGFPSFIEEMKIYYRERQKGHYGVSVYILSNSISSFPFLMGISLTTAPIVYFMVKLHPGFSHYAYFCLLLFSCISAVESLMMLVASLVPNFLMGVVTGSGLIGIMMMTAGFFRKFPELPKPFWRYPVSYLSYGAWAVQGGGKNDFIGLEFDPVYPGDPIRSGTYIINTIYGITTDHSKWWDLAALYSLSISYRLLFFVIQKFIEKAMPLLRIAYTKHTLQLLDKQQPLVGQTTSFDVHSKAPSFRVHSERHVPQYSLSAQEGLSSPIQ